MDYRQLMKTDRKLKRGLADLSQLFLQGPSPVSQKCHVGTVRVEPPQDDVDGHSRPKLICSTFLQSSEIFQFSDFVNLMGSLKAAFQETYFLAVAPAQARYEALAHFLPVGFQGNVQEELTLHLRSIEEKITVGYIPLSQFQNIIQPKVVSERPYYHTGSQKALAVFDSGHSSTLSPNIFELTDHCVFITSPDSDQLMYTYEQLKDCLRKNQFMRCSLLLVGRRAKELWEYIYEHFSEMVSQFLGCDMGFLGWIDGREMRLNPELLLEEGGNFIQHFSKVQLREALCPVGNLSETRISSRPGQSELFKSQAPEHLLRQELCASELIAFGRFGMELRDRHFKVARPA